MSLRLSVTLVSTTWLSIAMIACGGENVVPVGPETGPPAGLEVVSGNGQDGTVGQTLPDEITVRVSDARGNPLSGVPVVFSAVQSGGSFAPASITTDEQGEARSSWTLGGTPGTATATAMVDGLPPESLSAMALAGPAAQMVAVSGDGQHAVVGSTVATPPTVEVLDAGGNRVAGVTVSFEATGGATVMPGSIVTGTDGRAAPEAWTLGTTAGQNVLRASSTSVPGTVIEFLATGTAGDVSGSLSMVSASAGARLAGETGAVTVEAKDAFGNPVQGVTVHLDVTGSGHTLVQPEGLTDANGVSRGSIRSNNVGSTTVSAMVGNVPLEQAISFTVSYGEGKLTGLTYCTVAGVSSVMDVYVPPASHARPLPVAVHVHGGGYTGGSRSVGFWFPDVAQTLLDRGYLVVSVDYRLAPAHKYPAQIEDVKCAIRHLRANAAVYGLDPLRIGAWGSSAGAQLVGLLGTTDASAGFDDAGGFQGESSDVRAVIALSAITDFTRTAELNDNYTAEFPTWPDPESPELIEASPATHISAGDSPFLFIAGDEDDLVLPAQSQRMSQLLGDEGIVSQVLIVAHANHGLEPNSGPIVPGPAAIIKRMADFFDEHVR